MADGGFWPMWRGGSAVIRNAVKAGAPPEKAEDGPSGEGRRCCAGVG